MRLDLEDLLESSRLFLDYHDLRETCAQSTVRGEWESLTVKNPAITAPFTASVSSSSRSELHLVE